jgi:uncharacterized protein
MNTFLTCEWRKLIVVNYSVDPDLLLKYLPQKTELDLRNNICYLSLVGFMFLNTKIRGYKIPFHVNFEEVNLRFYVKYNDGSTLKRGVVFIKEIVPKPALALIANLVYKEHYITLPMQHHWLTTQDRLHVEYRWRHKQWNGLQVKAHKTSLPIEADSEENFILEHYWGYTKANTLQTFEYKVEHPTWQVYPVDTFNVDVNFGAVYGSTFEFLSRQKPLSVFLAEGSEVSVFTKTIL